MKNDGKEFEVLVHKILDVLTKGVPAATIIRDIKINGPDGKRQVDILFSHEIAGLTFRTIVECKDYKAAISVEKVDALFSKLQDLKASKGILVSTSGFTQTAKQKAMRLGIDLLIANHEYNIDLRKFLAIPVPICKIDILNIGHAFRVGKSIPNSLAVDLQMKVNGFDVRELFIRAFRTGSIEEARNYRDIQKISPETNHLIRIEKILPNQAQYVTDGSGEKFLVNNSMLLCKTSERWYLGEIRDFKSAARIINESQNNQSVVFDLKDIDEDLIARLAPYRSHDDVQKVAPECARIFVLDFLGINSGPIPEPGSEPLTHPSSAH